ncbi:YqgQ family protein [Desemzia sp. FAM 23991]|uniref:YqgQ family protein n=1 Tax=unclassified Desemzia TaxID=2685243 RepID=UPI003887BB47
MEHSLKSVYDVQQLLKRYGIFVHVGERLWDLELMMDELRKIYQTHLIERDVFVSAMVILKKEHQWEQEHMDQKNN